jgi:hypothetical protein
VADVNMRGRSPLCRRDRDPKSNLGYHDRPRSDAITLVRGSEGDEGENGETLSIFFLGINGK